LRVRVDQPVKRGTAATGPGAAAATGLGAAAGVLEAGSSVTDALLFAVFGSN
jgi:hypothetical protein